MVFHFRDKASVGFAFAFALCFHPAAAQQTDWVLEWSDEFDRTGSPVGASSTWEYSGITSMVREAKLDQANAFCQDGNLILEARKVGTNAYTSAGLISKKTWTQGRLVMRAKLPYGKGMWPAFWTFGNGGPYREIDIMELIGGGNNDRTTYGTLWWDSAGAPDGLGHVYGQTALATGKFADAYHTFGVDWDAERISFTLDDRVFFSAPVTGPSRSVYRLPQQIRVNLAVGGSWPGSPDASTVFPQRYSIDWIRVYQKGIVSSIRFAPRRAIPGQEVMTRIFDLQGKRIESFGRSLSIERATSLRRHMRIEAP